MTKQINIGTVSHGTMREQDLIPAFVSELKNQKPLKREHAKLVREIEARMDAEDYYESEDASFDLEALFDALDEYCAEYFYFGAHPGDGSDYGYWLSEGWEESLEDGGGIKVNDLSAIPADHVGHVAVVNDHGNVTLYNRGANHQLKEIWGIV